MIRALTVLCLLACGGGPKQAPEPPPPPDLPSGSGVYTVRYNPCACLIERPTLNTEVQTPMGWERVALEGEDTGQLVEDLLADFALNPDTTHRIEGRLTGRVVTWSGGHVSRVLVVQVIDPPEEPEE